MQARLDLPNDMAKNGEILVQRAVARGVNDDEPLCVLDIGANVGDWSTRLVLATDEERIARSRLRLHAFEPGPDARRDLTSRLSQIQGLAELKIDARCVSDREGSATFHLIGDGGRTSTLAPLDHSGHDEAITVGTTTVDAYCAETGIDRIDLMKIDTEGNDLFVLRGAVGMLQAGRVGLCQFEYNQRWIAFRSYLKDVFELVTPFGYSVGKLTPYGIEVYSAWHFELESYREGNYLLWRGALPADLTRLAWWLDG
jgi:FkbM family methyltransferase